MSKNLIEKSTGFLVEVLSVVLVMFIGYLLFLNNSHGLNTFNNSDVHRGFQRGINILNGINPYLEFNPEQMLIQEKVPGFFPLYFYLMALLAWVSKFSFVLFLDTLRYLVFSSYLSIGLFIYLLLRKQNRLLALLGMATFMFNRWTLDDVFALKQDAYVILPMLISLLLLKKNKLLSFFLYGVATAIKHLTIFMLPVYLLELFEPLYKLRHKWKSREFKQQLGRLTASSLFFLLPILGPSIPFIIETPKHYSHALLYNLTRESKVRKTDLDTGFDRMLILYNQDRNQNIFFYALPRAPMFILFGLLTFLYFTKKINKWCYGAFAYLIFVSFNPVLFTQYYVWLMVFIPLVFLSSRKQD